MNQNQIKINLDEFRNLLQKAENLSSPEKFLSQIEYQKLLNMEKKLIAHYYFKNKKKYVKLFKDYTTGELPMDQFKLIFIRVWMIDKAQSTRALKKLVFKKDLDSIFIDNKAENFTALLTQIFENCSHLKPEDLFFKLDYRLAPIKFHPLDQERKGEFFEKVVNNLIHQIMTT